MSFSPAVYERCLLDVHRNPADPALCDLSLRACLALEIELIYTSLELCDNDRLDDREHWMIRLESYMLYQVKG